MLTLDNARLKVAFHDNGCWDVIEKQSGATWACDPWERSSGEIVLANPGEGATMTLDLSRSKSVGVERQGSSVVITFRQPSVKRTDGSADVTLRIRVSVAEGASEISVGIEELAFDTRRFELVHVDYPLRAFWLETHVDLGYLAIPCTQGALLPTYPVKLGATNFWNLEDDSLDIRACQELVPTMPWFGAFNGKAGYVCILETEDDVHVSTVLNYELQHEFMQSGQRSPYKRIAVAYPRWLACMGALGYERRMRYIFEPEMGYVAMSKRYRRHASSIGLLKTLREKQEQRPQIAKLAGAPSIDLVCAYPHYPPTYAPFAYTYAGVRRIIEDLHGNLGLKKALFHLWGAFKEQPPKSLPFDEGPGSVEELKATIGYAQKDCGYLFSLYTDFSALLQRSRYWNPDLLLTLRQGGHLASHPWTRLCSGTYLDSAREVMSVLAKELGVEASYIDCLGGPELRECYSDLHRTTRSKDRSNKCGVLEYVRSLGLVYGGEEMAAWGMPYTDYGNSIGIESRLRLFRLLPVPLFHLVFHDSAVLYRDAFDHYAQLDGFAFDLKVLQDLLNGVPSIFYLTPFNYDQWRERIQLADRIMGKIVTSVAYDEMLSHEFLSDDFMVQRTVFASGVTVTTNLGLIDWDGDGGVVAGRGYRAIGGDVGSLVGQFTTDVHIKGAH